MLEAINGYKTYAILIITGIVGALGSGPDPIWVAPDWFWWADASMFGGAIRSAMNKIGK